MTWPWILLVILYFVGGIIFQHRAATEIRRALRVGILNEKDVSWLERIWFAISWPLMLKNMISGGWLPSGSPIKLAKWLFKGPVS